MKILLINPRIREKIENSQEKIITSLHRRSGTNIYKCPPLALYHLASYLKEDECTFIDEPSGDKLPDFKNYDLIMVTSSTSQAKRAREIGEIAKKNGVYSIVGGTHSTIEPEYFYETFDVIFSGECEITFPSFIKEYRAGNFSKIEKNYRSNTIDLSIIKAVRYDLIDDKKYDFIPIQISRGCPNGCNYCASSTLYGKKIRVKNIEIIREEIELIEKYHRGKVVYITDDNFIKLGTRCYEIIELFNKKNIRFICYGDVSLVNNEKLMDKLSENCIKLLVGFDSLNRDNLKYYSPYKVKFLPRYEEFIEKIQKRGIGIFASFIIGFDFDKKEVFKEISNFVNKTLLAEICLSILVPMPGTSLRKILENEKRIFNIDYSYYDGFHSVFKIKNLSEKELYDGIKNVLKNYLSEELLKKRTKFFKERFKERLKKI